MSSADAEAATTVDSYANMSDCSAILSIFDISYLTLVICQLLAMRAAPKRYSAGIGEIASETMGKTESTAVPCG